VDGPLCSFRRRTDAGDLIQAVTDDKQPPAALRDSKVGGIEHVFAQVISDCNKFVLQFRITRPRPHVHNVLQNDPARLEFLGKPQGLKCSGAAPLRSGRRALGTGVVCAFRRSQEEIDVADGVAKLARIDILQSVGNDAGVWKIIGVRGCCDVAEVNTADDFGSSPAGAVAAPASTAKDIQCSDHERPPFNRWGQATRSE
jgi:hypothetical protein